MLAWLAAVAQEEYVHGKEPFRLMAPMVAVEAVWTSFDEDLRIEDAAGLSIQGQMRLGEDYYYRLAGTWWEETGEDFAGGEDVEARKGTLGLGMDWTFGAFTNFSFDVGVGLGALWIRSDSEKDTAWLIELEAAARLKITPHVGLRLTGLLDFADVRFNSARTEHRTNASIGAGLEITF
jgi:hypothetical protein